MEKVVERRNYFPSGKIKSEWTILDNLLHGEYRKYLPNGRIIKKITYNKGVLEKVCDCTTDTVLYPKDYIDKFKKFSQTGLAEGMRAFETEYFSEIADIPVLEEKIKFKGQLLFKVWGKNSDLWLVFLIGDHRLIKIPVYRNREYIYTYTGKHCTLDFSVRDNWLETFEIDTMKASSGMIYINHATKSK